MARCQQFLDLLVLYWLLSTEPGDEKAARCSRHFFVDCSLGTSKAPAAVKFALHAGYALLPICSAGLL